MANQTVTFKIADQDWEFEEVHKLNYQTFVDEIPQHERNKEEVLIDPFHEQNSYLICLRGKDLLGMMALRDQRPFSLDAKLENLENLLPPFETVLEIRLLAIKKKERRSIIFAGIMKLCNEFYIEKDYDLIIISGTTRQTHLYANIGFQNFGPLVGKEGAWYQPMYLDVKAIQRLQAQKRSLNKPTANGALNFLPGPVSMIEGVMAAAADEPVSHRAADFVKDFQELRQNLCKRVHAKNVQLLSGSGTLGNDIVAAQLSLLQGRGLLLINGEFGKRLQEHANRAGLNFDVITTDLGKAFTEEQLTQQIHQKKDYSWLWCVHCETSTGILHDIKMLQKIAKQENLQLCLDAVSSIGSCEVDLTGVYLATAVSGKGIGSLPGIAMVFTGEKNLPTADRLPRYFDLAYYEKKQGIPFTISSNAVEALRAAVNNSDWSKRFAMVEIWSKQWIEKIERLGFVVLAEAEHRAPHVITIALPAQIPSIETGDLLASKGVFVSYMSEYLIHHNHIQICFMGNCQKPSTVIQQTLQELQAKYQATQPA